MDRRAERGEATRNHLLETATRLFTERGYDHTPIELVISEAGVSRGALYHHFPSKVALFDAALDAVQARVAVAVRDAARSAVTPLGALRAGCAAWLDLARDPVVRRIVILDAPGVVGWQRWREVDLRHSLGAVRVSLRRLAGEGRLPAQLVDVHAHVVLAAMTELALLIAQSDDVERESARADAALSRLLEGLFGAAQR